MRFKPAGKVYYFDPGELEISCADGVIVETAKGVEYGDVAEPPHYVPDEMLVLPLKGITRIATEEDREQREKNLAKQAEAARVCCKKVAEHGLDMKLVDVECAFNGSKIIFYFTSEGRVDFRELVKDLASVFKTRIELRQIGVRDEAKLLGGLGSCGQPVCCKTFLADFHPVSIKMAKEQNLSLSPTKISGLCGRLMCCLKYEQDAYESMRRIMPKVHKEVMTPDGRGQVLENNVIKETTRVRILLPDGMFDIREYDFRLLEDAGEMTPEELQEREARVQQRQEQEAARQARMAARPQRIRPKNPIQKQKLEDVDLARGFGAAPAAAKEDEEKPAHKRKRSRRRPKRRGGPGGEARPQAPQEGQQGN